MTYCVALKLREGLVLCSDSRTNAGVDHIASFRKLSVFDIPGDRVIFLQCAGNLASTQSVINILRHGIQHEERHILNVGSLFEVAELIGRTIRHVISRDEGQNQGIDFGCNILVSGQIKGDEPSLFHVYPQGNFIEATEDTPYFQIGESKYGKPILDRVITWETPLAKGIQCALISMDSTLRSNLSVGMPLDTISYPANLLDNPGIRRLDENDEHFLKLRTAWSDGLKNLFNELPEFF
ncbi:MAG: proteasome-type protease [Thalassolituus sp.]|jgi:putative proteasome-type protease|uniref:Putative proteasome-type protease n=1 Tax=Thalassolituus oleivorans MIL-1 TaxID=1298593 RepID=M5DP91_9GAMM|nr:proteasome-type protease [Thalassolituus oleivorans]PCI47200.1 MAG: peptidase [Oceanospirillales bacterium]AHK16484.1 peptidase [Thalassolituus oleivorans R6-15]APR67915.1 peptidase [Thalassolituus oleivorans]MBQ0725807.1 proteasome-type protease [Thalassolituus oleivorans]MBQ0779632.1 proteasome-type protease [Thalassolituus oleivorans]